MSSVSIVSAFFHRPPFLPASGAFTKSLHVFFVFKRVLLHISTHVLAPRHSFSYTFQKVFFKDELFCVNMLHYFYYFSFLKMKNRSRGTAFTRKHTLISLFWLQEAQEPCLSIESPTKTVQRLIHVFTGYTGKCRKSCALALYVCAYAAKHV